MDPAKIIIPTVLCYTKSSFVEWVEELKGFFKIIHVDVVDSSYGEQTWFDEIEVFEILEPFGKVIIHLMVEDPLVFLTNKSHLLKKDNVLYLIRLNKSKSIDNLNSLKELGYNVGVFFEIGDNFSVSPSLFGVCKEFMFLAVIAGKSGQRANLQVLDNIKNFCSVNKELIAETGSMVISVDGGLSSENALEYIESPANTIYANSYLKQNGVEESFNKLSLLNGGTEEQMN